ILRIALAGFDGMTSFQREGEMIVIKVNAGISSSDVNDFLIEKGVVLSHLAYRKKTLEQQFLELLQDAK
nr:ABC transporter ATP-binding protein [Bacteroidota bacterium]